MLGMLRLARRASPLGVALAIVVALQGAAVAATVRDVTIQNLSFNPASIKGKLGDSIKWTNADPFGHTSSSDGFNDGQGTVGVDLWHSGTIQSGGTFTFGFTVAGSFPYHCSIHSSMHGTVQVTMKAKPKSGVVGDTFKVFWATVDPGTDFKYNIQVSDPDGKNFHTFMSDVAHNILSAKFKPTQAGTYKFKAQLVRISSGAASGFSPPVTIKVS
jgi:plastocyanin